MKNYLYNKPIDQKKLNDLSFCIELYNLSDYVGLPTLGSIALQAIDDSINSNNFLSIALVAEEQIDFTKQINMD